MDEDGEGRGRGGVTGTLILLKREHFMGNIL